MSIKKQIQNIINKLLNFINNPNIYVAAIVGALVGLLTGGAVGLFSGGFIGYAFKICNGCAAPLFDINPDITVGGIIGGVLGAAIGGVITGGVTVYKVHKKTRQLSSLSSENIPEVLFGAFWISIEISIGMGLGAIIGSLKLPGIGSALGALMGTSLILFTSTLENKNER
ncbi:hypothetical protein [Legionella maioricensis]|uniref:Transmembrane protein n=1 Tax=Legionella maioricensis TaxID=2896528 RepID=A0A9X2IBJ4_9GAMM|nr:hypothetical protein [Legionella maioricensis]MCL9683452.1 hypothetical protein [Legionella maioricensis]MCL9688623.1 hypothetical protein [Legionella maioricensis]